jgi:all-trans-8'-apo-beta-carotenal 15,15'-oxygenase
MVASVIELEDTLPPPEPPAHAPPTRERPLWPLRAFEPQQPHQLEAPQVEGELPAALSGTFYRVGPSTLTAGNREPNSHWFDGDGMVCAFTLDGGKVHFKNRYVETPWYQREQREGRRLYSGFATVGPGLLGHLRRPKNPANTNVLRFEDRLLTLYEATRPFSLDPTTLAPLGEETFGGTLPPWAAFSAHPHLDAKQGALVSFGLGVRFDRKGPYPVAESWEVTKAGATRGRAIRLRNADVIHSFGLTRDYAVIVAGPYGLDVRRVPELLLGRRGIFDCVRWRPADPTVAYIARRDGSLVREYELPTGFMIHAVNAWQEGDAVVIDVVLHSGPGLIESIRLPLGDPPEGGGKLCRLRFEPSGRVARELLCETGIEFPTIRPERDGVPHRYVYADQLERKGDAFRAGKLLKIDTVERQTRELNLGESFVAGEPVFVARREDKGEDDSEDCGWALALCYDGDAHRSFLIVLDAKSWTERARVKLPFHVPMGLHASFFPAL